MLGTLAVLFAQRYNTGPDVDTAAGAGGIMGMVCVCGVWLVALAVAILGIVGMWKVFTKAGEPGWAAIVPIYNIITLVKISGKESWWVILFFLGPVAPVAMILVSIAVAERFGKSTGFGVGMGLLPMIFYPMLGFSDAQYQGPGGGGGDYGGGTRRRRRRDEDDEDEA